LRVWEDIQTALASEAVAIPVYFAYETKALRDYYNEMKTVEATSSVKGEQIVHTPRKGFRRLIGSNKPDYMMVLNVNDPKVIPSIAVDVFYGQQNFRSTGEVQSSSDYNPIIAISASYDALAISPELSLSLENSASGVIGELAIS
jgi:hypothetical protein